jgi:alginate O-acetyltransferase complex protein AlgI
MNFVSLAFLIFLVVAFIVYYLPWWGGSSQIAILIVSSLVFYSWTQPYLVCLLLISAFITSFASYWIAHEECRWMRRVIAIAGVGSMLLILGFFKYDRLLYTTIVGSLEQASGSAQWLLDLPLPIGISFYTFHGISLVVDTFSGSITDRKKLSALTHLSQTILYLTFFPQLIAGPIMKAHDFLPQIARKYFYAIDWETATGDLIAGYFLKSVVADNLSTLTSLMLGDRSHAPSIVLLMLIFGYSCQIFADFAGYSLIAIGLARLFGYQLITNFNFPYLASSFSEFWRRWHISLSTWLRDYLFIPLGGSRGTKLRTSVNIMVVMVLGGLWHGAAWSYAIWGTAHGFALVLERPFLKMRFYTSNNSIVRALRILMVVIFVSFCWLLFRLPNFSQVLQYIGAVVANIHLLGNLEIPVALLVYSVPVVVYHLSHLGGDTATSTKTLTWIYGALLVGIALNSGVPGAFIYFQF